MKKTILATALTLILPVMAQADEPTPEHTLTANVGLFSSYRFRGIDQTFGQPAIQGGVDYAHSSGFYAGNWNSNVNSGAGSPQGNIEMDFYGGYKAAFGDFGIDVGGIYYYYPGTDAQGASAVTNTGHTTTVHTGRVDNKELYIGGSWKFISLKYYHAIGDYFSAPDTKGSNYTDLSANYDLGNGWGLVGHVGHLNFKNYNNGVSNGNYTDWKLGVSKDLGTGWILGLAYLGTNAKDDCGKGEFYCFYSAVDGNGGVGSRTRAAGRATGGLSISKSF